MAHGRRRAVHPGQQHRCGMRERNRAGGADRHGAAGRGIQLDEPPFATGCSRAPGTGSPIGGIEPPRRNRADGRRQQRPLHRIIDRLGELHHDRIEIGRRRMALECHRFGEPVVTHSEPHLGPRIEGRTASHEPRRPRCRAKTSPQPRPRGPLLHQHGQPAVRPHSVEIGLGQACRHGTIRG